MDADKKPKDPQIILAEAKASWPTTVDALVLQREWYPEYARQFKSAYDALVQAGFSDWQALEIVKARGWMLMKE